MHYSARWDNTSRHSKELTFLETLKNGGCSRMGTASKGNSSLQALYFWGASFWFQRGSELVTNVVQTEVIGRFEEGKLAGYVLDGKNMTFRSYPLSTVNPKNLSVVSAVSTKQIQTGSFTSTISQNMSDLCQQDSFKETLQVHHGFQKNKRSCIIDVKGWWNLRTTHSVSPLCLNQPSGTPASKDKSFTTSDLPRPTSNQ